LKLKDKKKKTREKKTEEGKNIDARSQNQIELMKFLMEKSHLV
jgi:hypothetical protein